MKLYRFSPIQTKEQLFEAIQYVAEQTSKLCEQVTGKRHPIKHLTIFAHYNDEYQRLVSILGEFGETSKANNGTAVTLSKPIKAAGHDIAWLRVRQPDPYRMQVGCNDFEVDDYQLFKKQHLAKHPNNLRLIGRPEYEMIEFFDPNFDVLAYVLSKDI